MKKFLLLASCFLSIQSFAVTYEVEVGGGGANGTPFYDPQNLTILVGDVVNWTWTSGQHNVTSTSGPASFMSGNLSAPNEWAFTFDVAGSYDYECTLFNHATTQFGTIVVSPNNLNEQLVVAPNFEVYPNPAKDVVTVDKNTGFTSDIRMFDITGKLIYFDNANTQMRTRIQVGHLTNGIYFIEMNLDGRLTRRRLTIE
jgi:plastocyanin